MDLRILWKLIKPDIYLFKYYFMMCRHLLIAFGGLAGLEECFEEDNSLKVCIRIFFINSL